MSTGRAASLPMQVLLFLLITDSADLPAQTHWTERMPSSSPFAFVFGRALTYDLARRRIMLYGGSSGRETWEWDGATWLQRFPALVPSRLRGAAVAYDVARGMVV